MTPAPNWRLSFICAPTRTAKRPASRSSRCRAAGRSSRRSPRPRGGAERDAGTRRARYCFGDRAAAVSGFSDRPARRGVASEPLLDRHAHHPIPAQRTLLATCLLALQRSRPAAQTAARRLESTACRSTSVLGRRSDRWCRGSHWFRRETRCAASVRYRTLTWHCPPKKAPAGPLDLKERVTCHIPLTVLRIWTLETSIAPVRLGASAPADPAGWRRASSAGARFSPPFPPLPPPGQGI